MMRLLALLLSTVADSRFHSWCSQVGIETPLARLETTSRSVAGRGLFATEDIEEGDYVIIIPERTVLHPYNAARYFPTLASTIEKQKRRFRRRSRWWRRLFHSKDKDLFEFCSPSDFWEAELTAYSLASLESSHPWATWISQWQRSDPMQTLFNEGTFDDDSVSRCMKELQKLSPDVSESRLRAAAEIRIRRFKALKAMFDLDNSSGCMYATLSSRAIELGDGIVGVLPMFDMINHSKDPNLSLSFNGESFELFANRKIRQNEELFVCYTNQDRDSGDQKNSWNEDAATWSLIQWGIPQPRTVATRNELKTPLKM